MSRLDLSHNPVTSLDPEAFIGLEDSLLELDLEDTNLTILPDSLASLSKLRRLNIRSNSIKGLPTDIMAALGGSLVR